ncbi:MAG: hypothetical protein GX542_02125 [Rhodococcus sp.]|nr:hypothetical protein [Rhodococcus sp. (in: high G+C Gram-positive bacteria)]
MMAGLSSTWPFVVLGIADVLRCAEVGREDIEGSEPTGRDPRERGQACRSPSGRWHH